MGSRPMESFLQYSPGCPVLSTKGAISPDPTPWSPMIEPCILEAFQTMWGPFPEPVMLI
jgi:hypothetical protein